MDSRTEVYLSFVVGVVGCSRTIGVFEREELLEEVQRILVHV